MNKKFIIAFFLVLLGGIFLASFAKGEDLRNKEENLFYYDSSRDMKLEVSFYKKVAHLSSKNLGELKLKVMDADSGRSYRNEKNNLVLKEKEGKLSIFIGEKNIFRGELQKVAITENIKEIILKEGVWVWKDLITPGDNLARPINPQMFNLSFAQGKIVATTNCADFSGSYKVTDDKIEIIDLVEAKRFCENRNGDRFVQALKDSSSFAFGKDGNLILFLRDNAGAISFTKK